MNPNCHDIRPLLSSYVDRELDDRETQHVRTHLAECLECRGVVADYESVDELIAIPATRDEASWEALASRIESEVERDSAAASRSTGAAPKQTSRIPWWRGRLAWGSLGAVTAAALVLVTQPWQPRVTQVTDTSALPESHITVQKEPGTRSEQSLDVGKAKEPEGSETLRSVLRAEPLSEARGDANPEAIPSESRDAGAASGERPPLERLRGLGYIASESTKRAPSRDSSPPRRFISLDAEPRVQSMLEESRSTSDEPSDPVTWANSITTEAMSALESGNTPNLRMLAAASEAFLKANTSGDGWQDVMDARLRLLHALASESDEDCQRAVDFSNEWQHSDQADSAVTELALELRQRDCR